MGKKIKVCAMEGKLHPLALELFQESKVKRYRAEDLTCILQLLRYKGSIEEGVVFLLNFAKIIAEAFVKSKIDFSLERIFGKKRQSSYDLNHPVFALIHFLYDLVMSFEKNNKKKPQEDTTLIVQANALVEKTFQTNKPNTSKAEKERYQQFVQFEMG